MQQLQKLQQTIGKTEIKQAWNKMKASSGTSGLFTFRDVSIVY
jgi:hypothetical protein